MSKAKTSKQNKKTTKKCKNKNSCNSNFENSHNNNNNNNNSVMSTCSTPILAGPSNRFESLYVDAEGGSSFLNASRRSLPPLPNEHQLPNLPDIPDADLLNETQKKFLLLQMADKLGIKPEIPLNPTPTPSIQPSTPTPSTAKEGKGKKSTSAAAKTRTSAALEIANVIRDSTEFHIFN